MNHRPCLTLLLFCVTLPALAKGKEDVPPSTRYQALTCPQPTMGATWSILERDGANRQTEPYLSSLGQGESGVGMISSPPFTVDVDTIAFTIRGHDGQGGGQGRNFVALVDTRKGKVLARTEAPGNDALVERTWDVTEFKGVTARVEVHDGDRNGAFAWLGIGRIDAGPGMQIDFRRGLPRNWSHSETAATTRFQFITGGIPFKTNTSIFTLIPTGGSVEIPCGFPAHRLFLLGCTVAGGKPLTTYGGIEVHYQDGPIDVFPLMCGYTLDDDGKLLSPSSAIHLHESGDPFQHYLVVKTRPDVIEKIRLVANPNRYPMPRITAITCETTASHERLLPLPDCRVSLRESSWISSHAVSRSTQQLDAIMREIRQAHKIPAETPTQVSFRKYQLDTAFRSEGVAVADFNGDGKLDVAAGNVYYAAPDWNIVPMLGQPKAFEQLGYSDSFLCFTDDVDRDQHVDMIVVGFPGQQTRWLQNPGSAGGPWNEYLAVAVTGNESPAYSDIDADGRCELIFMGQEGCSIARPGTDVTQPWLVRPIAQPEAPNVAHGLGIGDINGDALADVVIPNGWWAGVARNSTGLWEFHEATLFGGAQLCVSDFDGDGDNDVLGSSAHGYGIAWCEQTPEGWILHEIDTDISQVHAIHMADINRDGLMDFVTGKRFWAHNGHDEGSYEPPLLCWFEQQRVQGKCTWLKHLIDVDSGVGLHFQIVDINNDQLLDVVTSNKKGVFIFEQVRP